MWTRITSSHSSGDMLKSMRSRRMPATQTTPSILPHDSTAVSTIFCPTSVSETSPATAMASLPSASISLTTRSATSLVGSSPAMPTP